VFHLIALAMYIFYESSSLLVRHVSPERSLAVIVIASISVIFMPRLARAKRRVACKIGSRAMHADPKQADFCSSFPRVFWVACCRMRCSVGGGCIRLPDWRWSQSL
jgi:divalent metal cation (Fe/Co/Zn/Cd) transporter